MANTSLVAENCGLYSWSAVVALVRTYDRRCARLTHTREGRDRKWSRRRWPAFLRERVSLGMQRAHLYKAACARARARAVVERPFEGQGSRLSPSADIYTRHGHYLYYLYRTAVDPDAVRLPGCLPNQRDLTRARGRTDREILSFFLE